MIKYIGMALTIYILINFVLYFFIYTQTKEYIADNLSWTGWINRVVNVVGIAVMTLPVYIYNVIYVLIKQKKRVDQ